MPPFFQQKPKLKKLGLFAFIISDTIETAPETVDQSSSDSQQIDRKCSPIARSFLAHSIAVGLMVGAIKCAGHVGVGIGALAAISIQAVVAAIAGYFLALRSWWLVLNLSLGPTFVGLLKANLPSWIYLVAFGCLLLFYSNSIAQGVPLYLSGRMSLTRVGRFVSNERASFRFIDLGCGFGSAVCFLGRKYGRSEFIGLENAPLVYLVAKVRSFFHRNVTVEFRSIWEASWAEYDVVYCFLSPVPMAEVWEKAKREMKPGSLLISNTFEIPGVIPHEIIDMSDWRHSKVFVWRM